MTYSVRDIATISITVSLTFVLGYVFYLMGNVLPIPGNKFLIFAPFLGFMIYIPIDRVGRVGVITAVSVVFGFIMGLINIGMAIAILLAGVTSDILTRVSVRSYTSPRRKIISAGFFSATSFLWAFIVSYYFTGNRAFLLIANKWLLIPLVVIIYLLGVVGALMSKNMLEKRVYSNY